ncbi:unnamed protein product [Ceratitis capitata]|uniref:(Mediterranean fruit fly) hypothetical protein n=1 Tax=Ceratitis capitata TaxID=7213 RepID=A0A811V5K0_CERCA|nr:unnamed protein product [Ceratitis capitata]
MISTSIYANKIGLSPFFCHNGDPLTTPPPAHCGIPPYQLDPKAMDVSFMLRDVRGRHFLSAVSDALFYSLLWTSIYIVSETNSLSVVHSGSNPCDHIPSKLSMIFFKEEIATIAIKKIVYMGQ